jgi:hypothetical protein
MEAVSDEHGERFNQDISQMRKRYSGKWVPNMLANYCRIHVKETPTGEYKTK